jgi:hypothetical protein
MNNYKGRRKIYKKARYDGPFKVHHSIEITSGKGFFKRLLTLLTNPFLYLFKGKIRY